MRVYRIVNKVTGKVYIGQTIGSIAVRWQQHCSPSNGNCRLLHRAIKKYGRDNFSISEVVAASSLEDLNNAEAYFIEYYQSVHPDGYNLKLGGDNRVHHPETRRLIALANTKPKGPMSAAHKAKISKSLSGVEKSTQHKEALSKASRGKPKSPEHCKALSLSRTGEKNPHYGKPRSEVTRRKMREAWVRRKAKGSQ